MSNDLRQQGDWRAAYKAASHRADRECERADDWHERFGAAERRLAEIKKIADDAVENLLRLGLWGLDDSKMADLYDYAVDLRAVLDGDSRQGTEEP